MHISILQNIKLHYRLQNARKLEICKSPALYLPQEDIKVTHIFLLPICHFQFQMPPQHKVYDHFLQYPFLCSFILGFQGKHIVISRMGENGFYFDGFSSCASGPRSGPPFFVCFFDSLVPII